MRLQRARHDLATEQQQQKHMDKGHVTIKRVSTQVEIDQIEFLEVKNMINGSKTQWIKK